MAKPERPAIVVQVELAIQMGAPCTQHVKTMMAYIQQLEVHAELQGKAISYLSSVVDSGGAPTQDEQATVRFVTDHILSGDHMETVQ